MTNKVVNFFKKMVEVLFSFQSLQKGKILIIDEVPYSGSNSYSFYRFLKRSNESLKVELLRTDPKKKVKSYLRRIYKIKGSQIVITSHGLPCLLKRKNQVMIQFWHGIPLKAMGLMDKSLTTNSKKDTIKLWNKTDVLISSSKTYNTLMNACVGIYKDCYVITGFPRNDYLFVGGKLDKLLSRFGQRIDGRKVVLFSPTFRKGYLNRTEGATRDKNIFGFENFDSVKFNEFLNKEGILFIAKLHPIEEEFYKEMYKNDNFINFLLLTSDILSENDIDLYEILPDVDLMVSDYSSIYFDFLLLDRPIMFLAPDLKEYENIRGFLLNPYDFWTPGPKVSTQFQLENYITQMLSGEDVYSSERKKIREILFEYQGGNSSERVFNQVIKRYLKSYVHEGSR